jgi:hypothetical protein
MDSIREPIFREGGCPVPAKRLAELKLLNPKRAKR